MSDIPTLIAAKNYQGLVECCEQLEIQSAIDRNVSLGQIYPIFLAACILTEDLQSARNVRKRILLGHSTNNTPEVQAIWAVVVSLIKKSYPQVYQHLDNFQWTEYMQSLIADIKTSARDHMLKLIPNIYTSIQLSQASNYFGLEENEVLQELTTRGWKFNETTRSLYPVKPAPAPRVATDSEQFTKLADIVLNLEKF